MGVDEVVGSAPKGLLLLLWLFGPNDDVDPKEGAGAGELPKVLPAKEVVPNPPVVWGKDGWTNEEGTAVPKVVPGVMVLELLLPPKTLGCCCCGGLLDPNEPVPPNVVLLLLDPN